MKEICLVGAVVVLGVAGGRLGFPAGGLVLALVGGLTVKALLGMNVLAPLPGLSLASQILVAYVLVRSSDLVSLKDLPRLIPAALAYCILLLGFSLFLAWLFGRLCGMDFLTALFATSPGGLTGIATVAVETGANAPVTVLFNLVRLVAILVVLPLIAAFWSRP